MCRTAGVRVSEWTRDFSVLHSVQSGSGAHPAFYPVGSGCSIPSGKIVRGVKLTTLLRLVPRSRMVELYLHSPIRLHGVVLNEAQGQLEDVTCRFCMYTYSASVTYSWDMSCGIQ
jgi:hypothetical protein